MCLLSKEDVIRKILYDFCNDHKTLPNCSYVLLRKFDVDNVWRDDGRGDEAQKYECTESSELCLGPVVIADRRPLVA